MYSRPWPITGRGQAVSGRARGQGIDPGSPRAAETGSAQESDEKGTFWKSPVSGGRCQGPQKFQHKRQLPRPHRAEQPGLFRRKSGVSWCQAHGLSGKQRLRAENRHLRREVGTGAGGGEHRRLFPQVDFAPSPDRVTTVRSEMFWMKNVTCRILNRMLQPSRPQPRQPHHCPLRGFGMGEQRMLASGSPGAHPGHGFSEKDSYLPYTEKH